MWNFITPVAIGLAISFACTSDAQERSDSGGRHHHGFRQQGGGQGGSGQRGQGRGRPGPHGGGFRGRAGHDDRHGADHEVFQFLLQNHDSINRTVTKLPDGVETLTESDIPAVAEKIKEHVTWMKVRIDETKPIRMRDPLFAELFRHAEKIDMEKQETEKGVRVRETSDDRYVARLIQAHAEVVSRFVEQGFDEAHRRHAVPGKPAAEGLKKVSPAVQGRGAVFPLPEAAHQPRPGTKLLVDLTRSSPPDELNPAIEKVAKYVNLYAGAGVEPAAVDVAVVIHGDAVSAVLNPAAYRERFDVRANPNLELLRQLHEAGVEMYVCGQSVISDGSSPEDVVVFVRTAVSALTAVANLQQDGYAYVPLLQ